MLDVLLVCTGMRGQESFRTVTDLQLTRSFCVLAGRSVTAQQEGTSEAVPVFPTHSDTRFSARSGETSQGGDDHGHIITVQTEQDAPSMDSHVPATRPDEATESTISRKELLRWGAYILGILLFVGGITITLFGSPIAAVAGVPVNTRAVVGLTAETTLAIHTTLFSPTEMTPSNVLMTGLYSKHISLTTLIHTIVAV